MTFKEYQQYLWDTYCEKLRQFREDEKRDDYIKGEIIAYCEAWKKTKEVERVNI